MRQPSPEVLTNRLKGSSFFGKLDNASLAAIAAQLRFATFRPGLPLFYEGAEASGLHIILSGKVALQRSTGSGESLVFAVRGAGEVVGEISLLDGSPATASVVAMSEVNAAILSPEEFKRMMEMNPSLAPALLKVVAVRLREATDALATIQSQSVRQRLAAYLLREADSSGQLRLDARQAIADRLGVARETVSRALAQLEADGAFSYAQQAAKRNTEIKVDAKRLRAISG